MIDNPNRRVEPTREDEESEPVRRRREEGRLPTREEARSYADRARAILGRVDDSTKAAEDRLREAKTQGPR